MKQFLVITVLGLAGMSAQAECYNFINGKGPSSIGNYHFETTTRACLENVNGRQRYQVLTLSNDRGAIVQAYVENESVCTKAPNCKTLQLAQGNIYQENVDLRATTITITIAKTPLNVTQGKLEIQAGRDFPQPFLIMQDRR